MNTIRKHCSRIKGGRLALAAHPARVVSLIVSDIPGDIMAQVASGPTVPDRSSRADALAGIAAHRIELPDAVMAHIASDKSAGPSPDDPGFARDEARIIASASVSLETAAAAARRHGFDAMILSDAIEGEAREVAKVHAAIAREVALRNRPFAKPVVILSGGETTVTVRGSGRGGRNGEFMLAFAAAIPGVDGIFALAADTDGIDGSQENAGAFGDAGTVSRLLVLGADAREVLSRNDSWTAFHALGDLFETGPTGTNVNDFRAILIR
jgi:hydroxypyruvate reductase